MPHWHAGNSLSIGHTPPVHLNWVTDGAPATGLAKTEGRNPAYSSAGSSPPDVSP